MAAISLMNVFHLQDNEAWLFVTYFLSDKARVYLYNIARPILIYFTWVSWI